METILVTGGAGFIGSNIADALVARGNRVVVIDDLSSGRLDNVDHLLHHGNFTFIRGSLLDRGMLRSVLKSYQVSVVSHQAAIASLTKSIIDPVRTIEANVTGTANLFDAAAESRCRRIVFGGSCAVYGDCGEEARREETALDPGTPYAATEATKELLARIFSRLHAVEITGLRYFNVYGRRQDPSPVCRAVVPAFVSRAVRNEPLPVEGDGLQTRDFVYIDDVVGANLLALTAKQISGRCFNIGSGRSVGILELAQTVIRLSGSSSRIVHAPPRHAEAGRYRADLENARKALGYEPAFTLEKGLAETIEWFRRKISVRSVQTV